MACRVCWCLRGKGQVKETCLQMFLEGSNWNGWMDRQQQVVPVRRGTRVKSSHACVGLDPRDWQTNCFAWSQWMGWKWWGKHGVKINRLLFTKRFAGQQNWSWAVIQISPATNGGNKAVQHCEWKEVTLLQHGLVDSEHTDVWWGSTNQSNFYSANIPSVARLSGTTARSLFKYKVIEAIL